MSAYEFTADAGRGAAARRRQAVLLGWGLLLACSTGYPQEPAAPSGAAAAATELAPITVTARLHDETEQSVPIGMTVLPGDRLATVAAPSADNAGLARSAPNVSFVDSGGQNSNVFNIRGVGSFAPLSPDDTSAVIYTNGVPRSVYGAAPTLMDIDRVEVLRGPQGTLFGRNTQGGAIDVIPNLPRFKPEYTYTGEIGSDGYRLGEIVANQPFSDDLAGRLALRYSTVDGTVPDLAAGGKDGGVDTGAARGSLLWTPDARTTVTFIGFYDKQTSTAPRFIWMQDPDFPRAELDPRNRVEWRDAGASLKVEHEFDRTVLTSLTSYQDSRSTQAFDLTDGLIYSAMTGRPSSVFDVPYADFADIRFGEQTWQQELRLSSPESSAAEWVAGVNYFHSSFDNNTVATASPAAFNFQTQNGTHANRIDTDSAALFGEATVPIVGRLKGTLGLRYTHENKNASYHFVGNGNPAVVPDYRYEDGISDDFVTGRAGLSYDWSDSVTTYATVSRGYVSGGFAGVSVNTPLGKPETPFPASRSWTYEIGFKSNWLAHRYTLNGSLFFNDVKNGHLIVFDPSALLFLPAALDYRSKGAELQAQARLNAHVSLIGGLGYTDAELVNVPAGSSTGAVSGNRVPNVARLTANAGLQFEAPARRLGLPGSFIGQVVWQHVGDRAVDVKGSYTLPAYDVTNLRLGWRNGPVEIYGFAYNLFDKRYLVAGQAWGPAVGSVRVGEGRLVGMGVKLRF